MRWARWVLLAVVAVSCGGTPGFRGRAAGLANAGELEAAIEELRFGLARHPEDGAAHAELARLQDRAGRPGAAIRHFEAAREREALTRADRDRLSSLYLASARARAALGDGGAIEDFDQAARLRSATTSGEAALAAEVARAGALAGLRAGDPGSVQRGRALLRRLAQLAPDDPRVALLAPDAADLDALGVAARWLYDGGARRHALGMLERYVRAGGRAPDVLTRWLDAERWWRGSRATLPEAMVDAAARRGLDVCAIAYEPSDRDCAARILDSRVLDDRATSARLWQRAQRLHWRTAEPALASAFVSLALEAWALGRAESWLGALTERVDVAALTGDGGATFAAATLARARGDGAEAARALERAIGDAAALAAHERAVVFCEAAVQGRAAGELAELALSGPLPDYAWLVAAAAARARGDRAAERDSLQHAGAHAFDYLAGHGDLALLTSDLGDRRIGVRFADAYARWYEALGDRQLAAGRAAILRRWDLADGGPGAPSASFGTVDAYRVAYAHGVRERAAADGLARVAAHYARDPALAERTARDYADEAVAAGERVPAIVALWLALGDAQRAHRWALELLATSPRHSDYAYLAGVAAAAAGKLAEADVHFLAAAATSGDGGAANLAAARAFLDWEHPLSALGAARRALELTATGEEQEVLLTLARAMRALGRDDDAAAALTRYLARIPAPYRGNATAEVARAWGNGALPERLAAPPQPGRRAAVIRDGALAAEWALDGTDPRLAIAYAGSLAEADPTAAQTVLDTAIAWSPGHVGVRVARLALASPSEPRYQELVGELLSIALTADGEQRTAALAALGEAFAALGLDDLAAAARRALRGRWPG